MKSLSEIMQAFGSDKSTRHTYTDVYEKYFLPLKEKNILLFELGLGTNNTDVPSNMGLEGKPGASLRGWKEFFLNGQIYGADIDKRILFFEDRIKTFYVDQGDINQIDELWNNKDLKSIDFDIMIDDGVHQPDPTFVFLKYSIQKLKSGGLYFIEDINVALISYYNQVLTSFGTKLGFSHEILNLSTPENSIDNVLAVLIKN